MLAVSSSGLALQGEKRRTPLSHMANHTAEGRGGLGTALCPGLLDSAAEFRGQAQQGLRAAPSYASQRRCCLPWSPKPQQGAWRQRNYCCPILVEIHCPVVEPTAPYCILCRAGKEEVAQIFPSCPWKVCLLEYYRWLLYRCAYACMCVCMCVCCWGSNPGPQTC